LVALVVLAGCSQPGTGGGEATDTGSAAPSASATGAATTAPPSAPAAPPAPPPQSVEVSVEGAYPANPTLSPAELAVKAGAHVTLRYTNNDLNPLGSHNLVIDGVGLVSQQIGQGESAEATFVAPAPGDYAYYCSLQGHREAGMEGVLHVS
jgi:nitrite reductase (NO-forming)